jgi:hypothetical protein
MTQTSTELRYLNRAPIVGDLITIAPLSEMLFEVDALDDLYGELVYAHPAGSERASRWYFLTHVKVIDDEPATDCHCGHPECGAC